MNKITKSDEEWKKELSQEEYRVIREKGTERAFAGAYWNSKEKGMYLCRACGQELFSSDAKFDSGTGWPSYWQPVSDANVKLESDATLGAERVEVMCGRCGAHLGHVFEDGPKPTGKRFCINSISLKLKQERE